jgi:SAC3/GANP family
MNSQYLPVPPYAMCSKDECADRERFGEVSVFECRDECRHMAPNQRRIDPCRAVSKYRRSAAGSSVEDRYPVRTVEQLATAVEYVLGILAEQRAAPTTTHDDGGGNLLSGRRETMLATVSFVEDRLRAVQVDLVKLQHPASSRHLQVRMARAHVVILYLMSDCESYEATFGGTMLQTALASFFASPAPTSDCDPDTDDEVLSCLLLSALRHDLLDAARASGSGGRGGGPLDDPLISTSTCLATHRRHFQVRLRPRHGHPSRSESSTTLQWTMLLMSRVVSGLWHMALRQLGSRQAASSKGPYELNRQKGQLHDEFVTLACCLLAPCLQHMRLQALKCYNASFSKGEAVPAADVARLVRMTPSAQQEQEKDYGAANSKSTRDGCPDDVAARSTSQRGNGSAAEAVLRFGQDVGLPVGADGTLLFKDASSPPLRMTKDRAVRNDEDFFVFHGWECRELDEGKFAFRTDGEGIRIPPTVWMRCHTAYR